jgi:Cu-processing system ATP-binding protein
MIRITGLTKQFGSLQVLRGLDLTIARGRCTAVLGPNGAGKSTLIKILLGLVRPDGGRIEVDGQALTNDPTWRARVGYMPQAPSFPDNLSAREVFAMLTALRGPKAPVEDALIDAFHLAPEWDKPLRTLSGGTRQKVSAALAFRFDPDLLILDEPTAGLDPVASSTLKDAIHAAKADGKTFILTSHILSEVQELADDLVFLLDGRIRFAGPVRDLIQQTGQARLERAIAHLMQEKAA